MEFSAPLASFLKPLVNVCAITGGQSSTSTTEDFASNVMLTVKDGYLTILGTNYKIELSYTVPVAANVEGQMLVNAAKLRETLSKIPSQQLVTFISDRNEEGNLTIVSAQTRFQIRCRNGRDFPTFDPNNEEVEEVLCIAQSTLKRILESSIFCVSAEEFREYLRGVRFEVKGDDLTCFTSDGHRMAMIEAKLAQPIEDEFKVTLLRNCSAELLKILESTDETIELSFSRNKITTNCNGFKLTSKLLICNYPNVRGVLPKEIALSIVVDRAQLKEEISKVAVLSSKRVNGVTLLFEPEILRMRAENSEHEVATSEMMINYDGPIVEITLNASYLQDVLGAMNSQQVSFNFSKPLVNALIKPEGEPESESVHTRYIISRVVV